MFEIAILCVIVFAVVYWAVLFIMGRRDDVLHGEFVKAEPQPNAVPRIPSPVQPVAPVTAAERHAAPLPTPVAAAVSRPPANTEALQSLLVSLKQELKNASKI
jgi:hypothetical protein